MNILILTDVLPAPILANKANENDVLLTTASKHEAQIPGVRYSFVFVVTYSNFLLSLYSKRWAELRSFRKLDKYSLQDREIEIIAVPRFKDKGFINSPLAKLGYYLYKKKIKRIVQDNKIDLVHAHNIKSDAGIAYEIQRELGLPYVVTSRKLSQLSIDQTIRKYLAKAAAIINLGFAEQSQALKINRNSFVVPHGVDSRFFTTQKHSSSARGKIRLVSLCRLLNWKYIDHVLLALETAQHDFVYDIYGDGPDRKRLERLLDTLNVKSKITFKGQIPYEDVPDMLAQYDVFVLPSFREMFGRVYIEAMACGLPVIGAKGCGIDGYIQEGKQGYTVNHRNIDEIAASIATFASNPMLLEKMSANAKLFATDFSWDNIIRRLDQIYTDVLKNKIKIENE